MPRKPRCVEPGIPYHVTQRGSAGCAVFHSQEDRRIYRDIAAEQLASARLSIYAYCWLTNHVHWIVEPEDPDSLAIFFRRLHGLYAQYYNARRRLRGHLWQARFFSCALDYDHLWSALRYVERNPVRAGIVKNPQEFSWSSAAQHLAGPVDGAKLPLNWRIWREAGGEPGWRHLIGASETVEEVMRIRRCTFAGKPYGTEAFVEEMERKFGRKWREPGRPRKEAKSEKGTEPTALVSAW